MNDSNVRTHDRNNICDTLQTCYVAKLVEGKDARASGRRRRSGRKRSRGEEAEKEEKEEVMEQ